jgi:molecular chaperone HtpG
MSTSNQTSSLQEHKYEAEVSQLLQLLASALYKKKEVFLRELISNASDATDKFRYAMLSDASIADAADELKIIMKLNQENNTLTIIDNGIGMNKEDLVNNLGTIARSGTKHFIDQLTEEKKLNNDLIGKFGVGFYSVFVVADKVEVRTRKFNETEAYLWTSNGTDKYTIESTDMEQSGTEIVLHLKQDELEFLQEWRVRQIVKMYSDHISLPIYLEKLVEAEDASSDDNKEASENSIANSELDYILLNDANALWSKDKKDITDEQYCNLYQSIAHDTEKPLSWAHHRVEGKLSYTSLLYIPKNRPFDIWSKDHRAGLKLYVKRVFILDDADQFLPMYLRFVKGILDTADLPLNVSREMLQDSPNINTMKQACVKRVLDMLVKMAKNNPEDYKHFWQTFGAVLKEGVAEDFTNKDKILDLLRFNTTSCDSAEETVSLAEYVARMQPKQDKIYYCIAESHAACKNSPHLEVFKSNNIEVLLLSDRIDEWLVSNAQEFDGKKLQSVARGDIEFLDDKDESQSNSENVSDEVKSVLERVEKTLESQVKSVKISSRLTDSSACLVVDDNDMSANLQRILKEAGQDVPKVKPILEINAQHPLVKRLGVEQSEDMFKALSQVILDQAILAEGGQLENPAQYVKYVDSLLRDIS